LIYIFIFHYFFFRTFITGDFDCHRSCCRLCSDNPPSHTFHSIRGQSRQMLLCASQQKETFRCGKVTNLQKCCCCCCCSSLLLLLLLFLLLLVILLCSSQQKETFRCGKVTNLKIVVVVVVVSKKLSDVER
jgi:hypothetical protein